MRAAAAAMILVSGCLPAAAAPEKALSAETRRAAILLRDKAFAGTGASEWARSLTDRVGPRPAGSEGDRAAVAWALAAMKSAGLSRVRAEKVIVPVWKRGVETGSIVAPYPQPLLLTALGGSVPTSPDGLEAEVLEVSSIEDLESRADSARGRIVFFDKKMARALDTSGYSRAVDVRGQGASAAAKAGAVGALIRSIGTDRNRTPHTGGVTYAEGVPRIPAAALSIPDAELLERIVAEGRPVRVRFTLGCAPQPDAESANVVGEIPGRGRDPEIVLLGAHLDSWDLGTGAIDDAAGCGIVLEAARSIVQAKLRPARTIRVVLFANEEHGLSGGKAYREAHSGELGRHVAALEADSGSGRPLALSWLAGPSAEPALRELAAILEPLGAGDLRAGGSGGADVSPLRADGVPQFSVRQDSSRYFDWHHTANDTFDKIEPESMDRNAAAVAAFAWTAASVDPPFERIPEDKRAEPPRARRR
ncbi:MAG: M20/M25/M40 family metallo-hydrolase [Acidobacteriota bacterium]